MLKIETESNGPLTVVRLIGRIRTEHIEVLESQLAAAQAGAGGGVRLNLLDVTLVDLAAVRFLLICESNGVELVNCSPYIREWIAREAGR